MWLGEKFITLYGFWISLLTTEVIGAGGVASLSFSGVSHVHHEARGRVVNGLMHMANNSIMLVLVSTL